jgi:plastocyanin
MREMSHDEHGREKEPIILTSGRRMAKGLAIVIITLAVGAAIAVPFFHDFYKNPPPVTHIRKPTPAPSEQPPAAEAGTTTISILQGASTQGSPDFSSDEKPDVPLGNKIVWDNQDTVPHTATSGTNGKPDGKFDTSIINAGEKSKAIELTDVKEGDTINYFCSVHPYMTSKITIAAKEQGGAAAGGTSGGNAGGAAGATLTILEGASVQGSPAFDPDPLKAKVGDTINVVNKDTLPHTVTSGSNGKPDGKFDTSIINAGESADITLDKVKAGEVDYFCTVHPYMTGKITVE